MNEIKVIIFMKILDYFPLFELLRNKNKKEKQAVWSMGVAFDILM